MASWLKLRELRATRSPRNAHLLEAQHAADPATQSQTAGPLLLANMGERDVSFGSELRQQREQRSVGLAEIAAATKLSERYLRALEADNHQELPGGIFNKGMVRGYCRHLGLDEQEWLDRFATSSRTDAANADWSAFAENVKATRPRTGASRRRWWGVLLMLLALAAMAWAAWHYILKQRMAKPKADVPAAGFIRKPAEWQRAPTKEGALRVKACKRLEVVLRRQLHAAR